MYWTDSVARFTADWRRSLHRGAPTPPRLADYVPDGGTARVAVLVDLVRIDLRHRWDEPGLGKRLSEYRTEFPEVNDSPTLVELVCEEFAARRRHGPLPLEQFLSEYPELADRVRDRLAAEAARIDAGALTVDRPLAEITPGQRIDDFDLLTDLGGSELGRVFLARQRSMQRLVAVRLSASGGGDRHPMARLDHPHIVRVFDFKELALGRGGDTSFGRLVYMQYLPGGTAVDVLEQRRGGAEPGGGALLLRAIDAAMESRGEIRPADSSTRAEIAALSWPETVAWVGRRLAEALDYAHQHGVRHRAIKPSNVLFTAEGIPKLADFVVPENGDGAAARGGSLPYRSPEELALVLDPTAPEPGNRGDIYSLGVFLWELLTGSPPFEDMPETVPKTTRSDATEVRRGDIAAALERRRRGVDPAALARIPPDCPAALRRILLTCLEPEPDRRWSDGAVLAQQLDLCLDARARDLVDPPEDSWRRRVVPWRVPLIALAITVPNILASLYNIEHDRALITDQLNAEAQHRIDIGTPIVNAIGFGLGGIVLTYFSWYLIAVPYGLRRGGRYASEKLRRARIDSILFGDRAILVIFSMWMISIVSFPIVLYGTGNPLTADDYLHFVASHAVCGAIALVYPFFLVNFYIVRCIYPMFLRHGEISEKDAVRLHRLRRRCGRWLIVAAVIPLAAVAGTTLLAPADLAQIIVVLRILAIGSLVAFIGAYLLFMAVENDLRALERVLSPAAAAPKAAR
ncbi:serine/threonine-protein kinase [Nocardia sp. NPDC050710]|uniref:serine/threonine-protein kinase n=1 Tax=Nocardia sp. NPDC050710 TaxID=3157220 RepID=UPI0033CC15D9